MHGAVERLTSHNSDGISPLHGFSHASPRGVYSRVESDRQLIRSARLRGNLVAGSKVGSWPFRDYSTLPQSGLCQQPAALVNKLPALPDRPGIAGISAGLADVSWTGEAATVLTQHSGPVLRQPHRVSMDLAAFSPPSVQPVLVHPLLAETCARLPEQTCSRFRSLSAGARGLSAADGHRLPLRVAGPTSITILPACESSCQGLDLVVGSMRASQDGSASRNPRAAAVAPNACGRGHQA